MSRFYPLTVAAVHRDLRDAVVLTFDVPENLSDTFAFRPGQHLTLKAEIGGQEVRRSYSICSAADEPIRVGIRKLEEGVFSTWANDTVKAGQTLQVMPPTGAFHVAVSPSNRKHYAGFASGSGITPVLGNMRAILAEEPESFFTLVYGNRATRTIMFREELADLKNRYMRRVNIIHVLSRETQDVEMLNGRLNAGKLAELFRTWLKPRTIDIAFICGPDPMIDAVRGALEAHGVAKHKIKYESFGAAFKPAAPRPAPEAGGDECEATILIDGVTHVIRMPKNAVALLDAAEREGIELPYACKRGVCSTCRCRLIEGEIDMDSTFGLEDYEIARGDVLSCQAFPQTDTVKVSFDDIH